MTDHIPGKVITLVVGVILPVVIFLYVIQAPRPAEDRQANRPAPTAEPPASMSLAFVPGEDGVIHLVDAERSDTLQSLASGEGGLLTGVLRPLERERTRHGVDFDEPYRLVRRADGTLLLQDPGSNFTVDVAAFGATSRALFNALLSGGPLPEIPRLLN